VETFKKISFLKCEKIASRKIFRHFLHTNFFMFINVIIWLFLFNLELIFKKAEIALAKVVSAISAFRKTHKCKLIPN